MDQASVLDGLARGRTDYVFDLLRLADWPSLLHQGRIRPLQWLVYYGDVTALKAVLEAGGDLASLDLGRELGNAAFFGHWKVCDLLLLHGADPGWTEPDTGETPLHGALAKANRPHYVHTVRRLLDAGADVNARTLPNRETGAFMRDVRTRGETPLHRAAAFADLPLIELLLDRGADPRARDAHGDSPLSWASLHLRPGPILRRLAFDEHTVSARSAAILQSDHGAGWGNGMEWKLLGDYLPEPRPAP